MSADARLAALAEQVGVFAEFTDMDRQRRTTSPDTMRALLRANGMDVTTPAAVSETLSELKAKKAQRVVPADLIIAPQMAFSCPIDGTAQWHVEAEDSAVTLAEGKATGKLDLPPLPMGIHKLAVQTAHGVQVTHLIVAPESAPDLKALTGRSLIWGMIVSLYGLVGSRDNEIGDYTDLAQLSELVGRQGASFLGFNPVHAIGWAAPDTISPYSPTHRGFLNTSHIAPRDRALASATNASFLDYNRHNSTLRPALEAEFEAFDAGSKATSEFARFNAFCASGGEALDTFGRFETLSETHGPDWRDWPRELQNGPDGSEPPKRVRFHKWLQWRAAEQLAAAQGKARSSGMDLGLYLDLAVGARLGGAESWGAKAADASGVSLGAPPDQLSPAGQNWQLAALSPRKLQKSGYRAFRQIIASNLQHCSLLRIDHALGLNRSYWIPEDGSPGGYIRQPFDVLLAIISIEATRAQALIVGEDLGLVPKGFREQMARSGLYGYTVMQYEKKGPGVLKPTSSIRPRSLACFGTHDTPTLRGYWEGRDIEWWRKLDWIDDVQRRNVQSERAQEKRQLVGGGTSSSIGSIEPDVLRDVVHEKLAVSPAAIVAVQLDDVLTLTEAQNLPGTIDSHPNWQRRYPQTIDEIGQGAALQQTARIMADAGRSARATDIIKEST